MLWNHETMSCEGVTIFSHSLLTKSSSAESFIPSHFYRELTRTQKGCDFLRSEGHFQEFVKVIRVHGMEYQDTEIMNSLKAALYAVGNIGSTALGIQFLMEEDLLRLIVNIAQTTHSVTMRGSVLFKKNEQRMFIHSRTCFFVLGLISMCETGVETLSFLGWHVVFKFGRPVGLCVPATLSDFIAVS